MDAEIDTPLDLPAPLLPADISATSKASFVLDESSANISSSNMGNLTLEDYLSTSADSMSLMSLDMSSQMDSENGPESLSMYRYVLFSRKKQINFRRSMSKQMYVFEMSHFFTNVRESEGFITSFSMLHGILFEMTKSNSNFEFRILIPKLYCVLI